MRTSRIPATILLLLLLAAPLALAGPGDGTVEGVTQIVNNGLDGERFDIVILSEGYTSEQLGDFAEDAQEFVDFFFSTPPFATNCSAFNVWRVDVSSTGSGADDPSDCEGGAGTTVDTYFDATFCADGLIRRLLSVNDGTALDVLNAQVPGWDQALVLVNSETYGGSGGSVAVSSLDGSWGLIAVHEMGHAAFGLADEYDYWQGCGIDTDRDTHPAVEPAQTNVTIETVREDVKWNALIDSETVLPTTENADCSECDSQDDPFPDDVVVGLYEGAHYYHCDVYRPDYDCMMRNFSPFCPVCTERILATLEPFQPENSAPVCDAGGPYTYECAGETTPGMLDGTGSSDPDCDELSYSWTGEFQEESLTGAEPTATFMGLGDFAVDLLVSDGDLDASCSTMATVQDTIAPVVTAPDDVEAECTSPEGTPVELGEPTVEEVCDAEPLVENDAPELFPLGDTTVTWTATDASGNAGSDEQMVSVVDTTPPELVAPPDVRVECASPDGTPVDLGEPMVSDICDDAPVVTNDAPALFPLGETVVTWMAVDASGNESYDTQIVVVVDTIPPELSLAVSPTELWPPNHKMKWIEASIEVSDICDASPDVTLDWITSDEPDNANGIGDGNTDGDIRKADYGTDDRSFKLRAERAGTGDGRVYTIQYSATDDSDNATSRQAEVTVPKSQGKGKGKN
jgi:hypothetical protein